MSRQPTRVAEPLPGGEVTYVLGLWRAGNQEALGRLVSLMYPELRRIAEKRMSLERVNHSLQPTALVNELFLHLARQKEASVQDRAHFLALASQVMKRLLIDYARAHNSVKRNSGEILLNLDDSMCPHNESAYQLVEIGDLLERMSEEEPRMARVFEMRCFGGLTHLEIAGILDLTERTVKRDWRVARAWFVANTRRETK